MTDHYNNSKNWLGMSTHFTDSYFNFRATKKELEQVREIADYMLSRGIEKEDIQNIVTIARKHARLDQEDALDPFF